MARDFSKIQKIVEENKRKQFDIPRDTGVDFSQFDKNTIAEYEAIPNHNVIERALDKKKSEEYKTKQRLLDAYNKAQQRETQRFVNKYDITDSRLDSAFAEKENAKLTGAVGSNLFRSEQSKKDEKFLASLPGADMDALEKYYSNKAKQQISDNTKEFAEDHPIISNFVSPLFNTEGSARKILETVGNYLTGTPMSNDSAASTLMSMSKDIKEVSKDTISEKAPEPIKKAANVAYDVGTGVLDFGTALLLAGGNPTVASGIMASNSAGNSFDDAIERGVNPSQIMATGTTNAAAEYLMNLLPMGAFDDALKGGSKNLVKNIAKQGVSEAIEEGTTEAVNTVADTLINKDKSNYELAKQQYLSNGMSEEEATKQAIKDVAKNVGYSALVGGLSGSTIGGGTTLYNGLVNRNNADSVVEQDTNDATIENAQQNIEETANALLPLENNGLVDKKKTIIASNNAESLVDLDKISNPIEKASAMNIIKDRANAFLRKAMGNKGQTDEGRNQTRLSKVPQNLVEYVKKATGGKVDISGKFFALEGSKLFHEMDRHSDESIEASRGQIPLDNNDMSSIIETIYNPDYVEYISGGKEINQREAFALIKADSGYIVVVENVGGKSNPNIVPEQILHMKKDKIDSFLRGDKSIAEIVYSDTKRKIDTKNSQEDIKNRVIVAQPAMPVANTPKATPHSPLFNNSVTNFDDNVNAETIKTYNTKSIDGFDDVSKEMNKLINMYGNDSVRTMHSQVMSLVNEYIATNDIGKMHEAMEIASEIDRQLLGKTYKYKATRKGTKGENARTVATYTPDSYIDTLYSEIKDYETMAGLNAPKMNTSGSVPYLENANPYSNTTNIEGDNQRVRSYNETLIEKTDAPQSLKNEFIDNPDVYTQLSNQKTLDTAMEILNSNDIDTAINEYHKLLELRNPVAVPLGYNISKHLAKNGKLDESVQIVREMSEALTKSGQFSQAAAITMLNNDPEAAKRYLVRQIDSLNKEGKEKFGKKWNKFELTKEELQRFNDIADGDADAIKNLYNDVFTRVRKEYPSTFTEKLMEYRRVAMLLNVRTNVRNVVSNAFMLPVRWTADRVAALGEGAYSLVNPKYSRTQSLSTSKESKQLASEAFETVKSELLGDNKYNDRKDAIRDKQVFKGTELSKAIDNVLNGAITKANQAMGKDVDPSLMETARNFTYYLLQKGDDVFVKKNFESRMASYLEAQGIKNLEDIPADAYMLATQEAMKATFKDDTKLSQGLTHFRKMLNSAPGGMLGDIVMPFTKTPANLAMRGIDYSPVGVINGINTLKSAKNNADVSKGITQLAQSATGTMSVALGMVLAESGLISGALSEDKDEAQFQRQQGMLPYAIKTPYGYFSYDWAQPASIPLILGVTIHDSFVNGKDFVNGIKQGGLAAVDSWLELSPLQNMSEIFGGYGTPAENVAEVLFNDFPLSFIPSQLNALGKVGDRTQRVSYGPDAKESFINQAKAKMPGLSNDLPVAYDTWGNPIERQDNVGEAVFANFFNPGQFGNENTTPIDGDIMALYDATGNASVFPKKAAWSYKVGGENIKLDNKQYSEFQRIAGSNAYDMADGLINSDYYNNLSDEQKAEVIADMYSFADALAKSEVLGYDVEGSDTYKKTYSVYKEKGSKGVALYTSIKEALDGSTNAAKVDAVNQFDISDEEKGYYLTKMITLSSAASQILETDGYAGVYQHYHQKALVDKVKEMRQPQSNATVTPEMIEAVRKMRSGK